MRQYSYSIGTYINRRSRILTSRHATLMSVGSVLKNRRQDFSIKEPAWTNMQGRGKRHLSFLMNNADIFRLVFLRWSAHGWCNKQRQACAPTRLPFSPVKSRKTYSSSTVDSSTEMVKRKHFAAGRQKSVRTHLTHLPPAGFKSAIQTSTSAK